MLHRFAYILMEVFPPLIASSQSTLAVSVKLIKISQYIHKYCFNSAFYLSEPYFQVWENNKYDSFECPCCSQPFSLAQGWIPQRGTRSPRTRAVNLVGTKLVLLGWNCDVAGSHQSDFLEFQIVGLWLPCSIVWAEKIWKHEETLKVMNLTGMGLSTLN